MSVVYKRTPAVDIIDDWFASVLTCDFIALESLRKKVDINVKNRDGNTALIVACKTKIEELVEWLLSLKPELDIRGEWGHTALTIASFGDNHEVVYLLLEAGANVNSRTDNGNTALEFASDALTIKCLIKAGACLTVVNDYYESILCSAIFNRNAEKVRLLAEAGIDVNVKDKDGKYMLSIAVSNIGRCKDIVYTLIKYSSKKELDRAEVISGGGGLNVLGYACVTGNATLVKALLDKGVTVEKGWCDTNTDVRCTQTSLGLAIGYKFYNIVAILLRAGARTVTDKDNDTHNYSTPDSKQEALDTYVKNMNKQDAVKIALLALGEE